MGHEHTLGTVDKLPPLSPPPLPSPPPDQRSGSRTEEEEEEEAADKKWGGAVGTQPRMMNDQGHTAPCNLCLAWVPSNGAKKWSSRIATHGPGEALDRQRKEKKIQSKAKHAAWCRASAAATPLPRDDTGPCKNGWDGRGPGAGDEGALNSGQRVARFNGRAIIRVPSLLSSSGRRMGLPPGLPNIWYNQWGPCFGVNNWVLKISLFSYIETQPLHLFFTSLYVCICTSMALLLLLFLSFFPHLE